MSSFPVLCHLSAYDPRYKKEYPWQSHIYHQIIQQGIEKATKKISSNPQTAITAAITYIFISKTPALRHILTMPRGTNISRMHHVPTKLKENS